jgi:DNA-binding transcriptional ArsR family regulator
LTARNTPTPARSSSALAATTGSAPIFAALGDETRLRLVARLCNEGPMSIARLTADARVTRQAVSKHLRVLEDARLVRSNRQGRESIWELNRRRVEEASHYLDLISRQWDDTLERLRQFVEE